MTPDDTTKKHFSPWHISLLCGMFLAATGFAVFFLSTKAPAPVETSGAVAGNEPGAAFDPDVAERYWSERMAIIGAQAAYAEFIRDVPLDDLAAHERLHTIGALLYDKQGWDGLKTCDNSFTYACYHGVMERAIEQEGPDVAAHAQELCPHESDWERDAICFHGVGHGVLASVGHEYLDEALALCEKLHRENNLSEKNITACFSGVFMEYHFTDSNGRTLNDMRQATESALHEPCSFVAKPYKQACYFEQPDWWKEALRRDYRRIGALCEALPDEKNLDACFFGLGFTISREPDEGTVRTREICASMVTASAMERCIAGTAWYYFIIPGRSEWARALCNPLQGEARDYCLNPPFGLL